MPKLCSCVVAALAAAVLAGITPARAADPAVIHWRTDYNAARKEAQEKGLPLLVEIGSDNCTHCVKQDATTFRDPGIVALLNGHFVPIRVDGNREPALVEALRVQVYPTTVVAAPDGRVLAFIQGYVSAEQLREQAGRAVPAAAARERAARDLLAAAREAFRVGRFADCLEVCDRAASQYAGLPEGKEAAALAGQVRSDPARLSAACEQLTERTAALHLMLAEVWLKKGQAREARECLEKVVQLSPGGKAAESAEARLASLRRDGPQAVPAGFEKK
jgi:thioredoxin-like negative regulator of GroEL